jgi:hypothetical protein
MFSLGGVSPYLWVSQWFTPSCLRFTVQKCKNYRSSSLLENTILVQFIVKWKPMHSQCKSSSAERLPSLLIAADGFNFIRNHFYSVFTSFGILNFSVLFSN